MNKKNKSSILALTVGAASLLLGLTGSMFALAAGPSPVNLLSAGNFAILSKTGITNTGSHTSAITGNIGSSPVTAAAMNNVFCSEITGTIYGVNAAYVGSGDQTCFAGNPPLANKTVVDNAVLDMGTAYGDAAGRTGPNTTELGAGDISGLTIPPGLHKWSTNVVINSNVTLSGGANDVWIFQIAGDLNIASAGSVPSGIKVILAGGAQAANVFWQVGGPTGATLGTYATFNGTILTAKQVILQTGAVLNGRALAQTQVVLDANPVTAPAAAALCNNPVTLVSGTNSQTAGYTEVNPSATPLVPGSYTPGVYSAAIPTQTVIPPWVDPATDPNFAGSGALWISTHATWPGGTGNAEGLPGNDQWRLFNDSFVVPPGSTVTGADVWYTADNAAEVYLNGSSIGTTNDVFGAVPGALPQYFASVFHSVFAPAFGTNTLNFVVRNWGGDFSSNPTGLLYKAVVTYCVPPAPPPANACSLSQPPVGFILRSGTSGNDTVTLSPNTMFKGNGGYDKVTGGVGNYIVCTGSGNDIINLGDGDSTIDAGGGNNSVTLGNGTGYITAGTGSDTILTGNGARTIDAGSGNNSVTTGSGNQNITTGSGIDTITTDSGADTINAGSGNNTVKSGGGADTVTTGSGADFIDAGADTDTCSAGGGANTVVNCAP